MEEISEKKLRSIVKNCRSFNHLLIKLNTSHSTNHYKYVREKIKKLSINVSHFRPYRQGQTKVELQKLKEAVKNSHSMTSMLRYLGLSITGSNHTHFKEKIKILNIDNSHWTGQSYLKGKKHNWTLKIPLEEILIKNSKYKSNGCLKRRLIKENVLKEECSECKLNPIWNGKKLVLVLDHINGDHFDNRIENLRLLCPNCNSQQETFCSKNRKSKRQKILCIKCGKELKVKRKTGFCVKCFDKRGPRKKSVG